jgi:hypothetical protein
MDICQDYAASFWAHNIGLCPPGLFCLSYMLILPSVSIYRQTCNLFKLNNINLLKWDTLDILISLFASPNWQEFCVRRRGMALLDPRIGN